MEPKTKNGLVFLSVALLIIMLSSLFRTVSSILYYLFMGIGLVMVVIAAILYFKNKDKDKKDNEQK